MSRVFGDKTATPATSFWLKSGEPVRELAKAFEIGRAASAARESGSLLSQMHQMLVRTGDQGIDQIARIGSLSQAIRGFAWAAVVAAGAAVGDHCGGAGHLPPTRGITSSGCRADGSPATQTRRNDPQTQPDCEGTASPMTKFQSFGLWPRKISTCLPPRRMPTMVLSSPGTP